MVTNPRTKLYKLIISLSWGLFASDSKNVNLEY